ncbi:MAG: protein kinase [Alphaproteobacteria bacterium]
MPSLYPKSDGEATVIRSSQGQQTLGIGTTLINGTYIIEEFLARGGMGEVYRARHIDHDTQHAIKVILPELANDETILQLFIREARELGRVNSDAIVRYQGFLRDERGFRCLIMEFVEGESLKSILRHRRFDPPEVLTLLERIGNGLAAVHDLGMVHRDISPENIIVPEGGIASAKLIDFGIAKSGDRTDPTLIGTDFAGKFSFASPEQAGLFGGMVDARSDIYSLGLVLAATALGFGEKLDMGASPAGVIKARQAVPDLTALPVSLRPVIGHMLEPDPADRPASIRAVLDEARLQSGPQPRSERPEQAAIGHRAGASDGSQSNTRDRIPGGLISAKPVRLALAATGTAVVAAGAVFAFTALGPRLGGPSLDRMQADVSAAAAGYNCADLAYSVRADRTVNMAGFVSSDQDLARLRQAVAEVPGIRKLEFDVQSRVWPNCEALSLLKPYFAKGTEAPRAALLVPESERNANRNLVLDVRSPQFDSYIYVDYFTPAGEVVHLFPNKSNPIAFRPIMNRFVLGRPPMQDCWTFREAPGEQLITVIASERRLFENTGSKSESAKGYLDRLASALQGNPGRVAASALFFELDRDHPSGTAGDGCKEK